MKYSVSQSTNIKEVIAGGWKPIGGISATSEVTSMGVSQIIFTQAMIKEEEDK